MRGRTGASFTDADTDASHQQLRKAGHHSAKSGHQAPDSERCSDNIDSIGAIGPARYRDAAGHIKDGKTETRQQGQLTVAQTHIGLDRLLQDDQNLAVDEVEDVDDHQQRQHIFSVSAALSGCRRPDSFTHAILNPLQVIFRSSKIVAWVSSFLFVGVSAFTCGCLGFCLGF